MEDALKLTSEEASNPVWLKAKLIIERRLRSAQTKLEGNLTPDETNRVRGRILELKELLKLGDANPEVEIF